MKFYMQTSKIYTRHHLQGRRPRFDSWVGKIPWRRNRLPAPVFLGFPGGSDGKESAYNAGDLGLICGLGRSPGGGHGNPVQYSCLENPHGQRSLAGYHPQGCKELDTTGQLSTAHVLLIPNPSLSLSSLPKFPFGNHKFVFKVCESV